MTDGVAYMRSNTPTKATALEADLYVLALYSSRGAFITAASIIESENALSVLLMRRPQSSFKKRKSPFLRPWEEKRIINFSRLELLLITR